MARRSVSSFRLLAVSASSRLPSNRSRSTARNASISTSCEDTTRSGPPSGTLFDPDSEKTIRRTALASTYFTRILAHHAKRRLDVDASIEPHDLEFPPVLRAEPQPAVLRQSLAPRQRL